jgi:hypothetical protein
MGVPYGVYLEHPLCVYCNVVPVVLHPLLHSLPYPYLLVPCDTIPGLQASLINGGSKSLGHLVQGEQNKCVLLRYMTKCRQIICQTHHHLGTCPFLHDQLQQRGLINISFKLTGFENSFEAVQNLPRDAWRRGCPALFEAIEASVTEGQLLL